jgi:hypothetical protein
MEGLDSSIGPSTGYFQTTCSHDWHCRLNYDQWPTKGIELISYRDLSIDTDNEEITFNLVARQADGRMLYRFPQLPAMHVHTQHNDSHLLYLKFSFWGR